MHYLKHLLVKALNLSFVFSHYPEGVKLGNPQPPSYDYPLCDLSANTWSMPKNEPCLVRKWPVLCEHDRLTSFLERSDPN